MADSSILVSGLTAIGGVGQVTLSWSVGIVPCLSYLMLDKVEVWASPTNNRAGATKVGEVLGTQWVHSGLIRSTTRYYWIRARDTSGNEGEYFPASQTTGIVGTTTSNAPNASVLSDVSNNAGNINAGNISGVTITGGTINGALIRTTATGPRIEISGAENSIEVWPNNSAPAILIRAIANNTMLTVGGNMDNRLVSFQNSGSRPALHLLGNANTPAVLQVDNDGGVGAGFSAIRGANIRSGGGVGFIGRSPGSGGQAFYATAGGYGPFTGQHDALLRKADEVEIGDIVIDEKVISRSGVDDTLTLVRVSEESSELAALGVVSRRTALDPAVEFAALRRSENEKSEAPTFLMRCLADRYDLLAVNSVGEGQINVCGRGGDIKAGELLITSSMRGKAERQPDLSVYAVTVAKAREAVTFDYPDQVRRVACVYLCG